MDQKAYHMSSILLNKISNTTTWTLVKKSYADSLDLPQKNQVIPSRLLSPDVKFQVLPGLSVLTGKKYLLSKNNVPVQSYK